MDENSRRRRHNEAPMHATANPRFQQSLQDASQQQQRRAYGSGASDSRYRTGSATSHTSPAPAAPRSLTSSASYGNYYQEPSATTFSTAAMSQGTTMGYQQATTDYGQDTRQTQTYAGTYNPMMYNVQQAGPQGSAYDASQQFAVRQPAGLQMITTDVTAPYFPSEPASAATATGIHSQTAPSSASTHVYQQSSADRASLLQSYSTPGMQDVASGMAAQSGAAADVSMEEAEFPAASTGLDDAYNEYQNAVKQIFENIQNGVLAPAGESLLNVSEWLLTHVTELGMGPAPVAPDEPAGLTTDDQSLRDQRTELWTDFNHAWLAIFQRQKDMMLAGQRSSNLIAPSKLEKMGKDLIKWCDNIERHGLVDYQYGVEEERILDILEECLDLYDQEGDSTMTSQQ